MLARRQTPATKVFATAKPFLPGEWPAGRGAGARRDHSAGLLPGVAEVVRRPKITAATWITSTRRGDGVAVLSFILRAARVFRNYPAVGYMAAFASVGLATALQWVARDLYQGTPFLTIYPAIVLTALVGGYRAGLLSALLAGLSQWYFFIAEPNSFAIITFVLDAIVCVALIEYINRSIETETQAKEHENFLKQEMHHRMHNLLTVIQSVIRFSLPSNNVPVFPSVIEERLFGRLQAMFDANRYVSDAAGTVALIDLIRGQIRGFGNRITIRGRSFLLLDSQMTQNFSLIVHELVTNSLKYGALSTAEGRVQIDLKETRCGVAFDWTEANGPAVKATPGAGTRAGFGSHILGAFARGFCSDVKICYEPSGLRYSLRIPRDRQN
jgi:two-component sensor histidine kinase